MCEGVCKYIYVFMLVVSEVLSPMCLYILLVINY